MISIVMAYYNRLELLKHTLHSLRRSKIKDYEVVIVDDGSDENEYANLAIPLFPDIKINVIYLEKKNKWYLSPCVPFNIGFKAAKGNIIIIQNPECFHTGDILENASQIQNNEYRVYATYALPKNKTNDLHNGKPIQMMNITPYGAKENHDGWYTHSKIWNRMYHWCTAINKVDLEDLGGFDERYAQGIDYDDNELLARIQRKKLKILCIDNPFVFHQNHGVTPYYSQTPVKNNKDMYYNVTLKETTWTANRQNI